MKTKTTRTSFLRMSIPVLLMALPGMAAVMPVSYDFGSGTGQTTFGDAGFTAGTESGMTISNEADSVRFDSNASNRTGGITRTFTGLGENERNDFTITSQITLDRWEWWVGTTSPFGIALFSNDTSAGDLDSTGLTVRLRGSSGPDQRLQISEGINGSSLAETSWTDEHDQLDTDFVELNVDVSFSGTNDMLVEATLTRLQEGRDPGGSAGDSITVSHFFEDNAGDFMDGDYFGFAARLNDSSTTHLNTFAVIPEPGTLMLVGIALAGLLVFRRRRK